MENEEESDGKARRKDMGLYGVGDYDQVRIGLSAFTQPPVSIV